LQIDSTLMCSSYSVGRVVISSHILSELESIAFYDWNPLECAGLDLDCLIIRSKKVDAKASKPGSGGLQSLTARAPEPLAELVGTAADIGSRFIRWISGRP
jgi:hypothetical protein